ncbi:MAG: hypothetical protein JW940_25900 [Polyangiaceae bacterium]|nr:hypothetical protein [Polyangiaceae bacterium]
MKHPPSFLQDAAQTAYLWSCRNCYGNRNSAVKALLKRKSAEGRHLSECQIAFDVGLRVVTRTQEAVSRIPSLEYLPDEEARRIADEMVLDVRRAVPESTPEMVDYAMGMLFWMPITR